jgi:hypothetical protein
MARKSAAALAESPSRFLSSRLVAMSNNPPPGDRGFLMIFGSLTVLLYLALAVLPVEYTTLLVAILLLRAAFLLASSAVNGLLSTLGQQHVMAGQVSTVLNLVLSGIGVAALLLGGGLSGRLEQAGGDGAFHALFLLCAGVVALMVLFAWLRPRAVFDAVRPEQAGRPRPLADLRRLLRHRAVYPALLIMLLWSFAPGSDTPLLYYLQRNFHTTDAQWGAFNALFAVAFVPTMAVFGFLCTRVPLRRLLVWGTVVGVPQMVPLLFIRSANDALVAAVAMGLMGGVATAAYLALIIRACPPGLQGTVLMMSGALSTAAVRLGDILGTRLYDDLGGFRVCVIAITITYALILPVIGLVPPDLIAAPDARA